MNDSVLKGAVSAGEAESAPACGVGGTGRIVFLDLARGLAILFMVMQHAMIVYAVDEGEHSVLGKIVLLLGTAPAAPVFLLIMGIFLARSKGTVEIGVRRGLKLVALGYLLNLVRFTVPLLIAGEDFRVAGLSESPVGLFWAVDILQMAGLAFIVLTVMKIHLPWRWVWALAGGGVVVASPALWGVGESVPGSALLWGTGENVFFPLFPWMVFPVGGMVYSRWVFEAQNWARLIKRTAGVGVLLILAGVATLALASNWGGGFGDYCRSGPGAILVILGFVFLWLPLCWIISERRAQGPVVRLLCFWSRYVTVVYFVQWALIGWGMLLLDANRFGSPAALGIGGIVLLLTHFITSACVARRGRKKDS